MYVNLGMFAQEVKAPEVVQRVLLFNSRACWALGDGTGELSHNVLTEIAMTECMTVRVLLLLGTIERVDSNGQGSWKD